MAITTGAKMRAMELQSISEFESGRLPLPVYPLSLVIRSSAG